MNLSVVCVHCGHSFKVAAKFAGRRGRCPNPDCGQSYMVPERPLVVDDVPDSEADAEIVSLPEPATAVPHRKPRSLHGGDSVVAARAAEPKRTDSLLHRIDRPSFLMGLSTTAVITVCALIAWSWLPGKGGGAPSHAVAANAAEPAPALAPRNVFGEDILPILQKNCAACHTGDDAQGGFVLTEFPDESSLLKHRRQWEKLTNLVSAGIMPPADEPQPTAKEKETLLDYLESTLFSIDCSQVTDPGRVTIRRLNRFEYNNTVRDLVGIDFRPAQDFPSDDVGHGFDNIGEILTLPPLLMEKYLSAAEKIAAEAIADVDPDRPQTALFTPDRMQHGGGGNKQPNAVVLFSVGEAWVDFEAPLAGTYQIVAKAAENPGGNEHAQMEFRLDDKPLETANVVNSAPKQEEYQIRAKLDRGKHKIGGRFVNDFYDPKNEDKSRRDRNLLVYSFEIRGPFDVDPNALTPHQRQLLAHHPRSGKPARECVLENLRPFVPKAFRRPVRDEELQPFVDLAQLALDQGESFEFAMQTSLTAVLVSPHFLFRVEQDKSPSDPEHKHPLDDYELAVRLSYFLWSSMPDDELFQRAEQGDLHTDAVLEAQVQRMLKDPKASALVTGFGDQWLNLRILDEVHPDPQVFPEFSAELKEDMKRETRAFFEHVVREDRSILDFLEGPYTFVNGRLAKHYGIGGVEGDAFQKVSLEGTPRAGLLTQASILTLTSAPKRTSPVKRGKWMLEVILDEAPPPPPPNVPELAETERASPDATLRQQLEQHRANPVCASCHKTMDALGFGMEGFDAIGRFRDADQGKPLDTSGELPGGRTFHGPKELIGVLGERDCDFARTLARKMLTYALGRGLEYYDRCAVDTIVERLKAGDDRFSVLVKEIAKSRPFRMRRGEGTES
jgi:mono/diheme cytochrome c family protein